MRRLEKDLEGLEVMLVDTHTDALVWLCQGEEHRKRPFPADFFFFSGQMRSWKVISKVSFLLTMVKN